jgi:uncharacterized phage infection (PIP) family protein YhgE
MVSINIKKEKRETFLNTDFLYKDEIHSALNQFIPSIEPVIGKLSSVKNDSEKSIRSSVDIGNGVLANINNIAGKSEDNLEDVEGLRNMVEELKDNIQKLQETTAKIRREKNELLMKYSKAAADIKERDDRISLIENEKRGLIKKYELASSITPDHQTTPVFMDTVTLSSKAPTSLLPLPALSPPPPPPPPPPPMLSLPLSPTKHCSGALENNTRSTLNSRNNTRKNMSHRSSRYLHPLALNLYFPDLKSLHENCTPVNVTSIINTPIKEVKLFNGQIINH